MWCRTLPTCRGFGERLCEDSGPGIGCRCLAANVQWICRDARRLECCGTDKHWLYCFDPTCKQCRTGTHLPSWVRFLRERCCCHTARWLFLCGWPPDGKSCLHYQCQSAYAYNRCDICSPVPGSSDMPCVSRLDGFRWVSNRGPIQQTHRPDSHCRRIHCICCRSMQRSDSTY